jgi:hypothetical protein
MALVVSQAFGGESDDKTPQSFDDAQQQFGNLFGG